MITYHYACSQCSHQFTTRRSIKDPPLLQCPACEKNSLRPVFHPVETLDTTPRTLGGQADRNHARAGAYEREARHREIEEARTRARAEQLPEGMTSVRKPKPEPTWWRPGRVGANPELVRADPEKRANYIEKGTIS